MKLQDLHENILWEDDEMQLVITEASTSTLQVALKGKAGELVKDVDKLAKQGIQKAGIIGAFALDHLKRYKKFKHNTNRSIAFYARGTQEKRAYEKMIKAITKTGEYKIVRTFPYASGGRMWEIRKK